MWDITFSGIRANEVVDAAAKMALTDHNITLLTLPISTSERLIAHTRQSIWNESLTPVLQTTSMGQYHNPYCPWCISIPETMNHFMLECPRFHSHRVVLQKQLCALGVTTFDLPTLLGATGIDSSRQSAVLCLTCAFLNKTNQLQRL
ncbi:hypothetical protein E2C01_090345 [Portunus trituberculatus]|uniref:RNase H type-1 domain-containing protein n=1 Tax=Portunus trituberculatus TaxID=210409 RepID=A0A5B7JQ30_PORTR|nr:hypothetical protein [Portunus trituberculatus]